MGGSVSQGPGGCEGGGVSVPESKELPASMLTEASAVSVGSLASVVEIPASPIAEGVGVLAE